MLGQRDPELAAKACVPVHSKPLPHRKLPFPAEPSRRAGPILGRWPRGRRTGSPCACVRTNGAVMQIVLADASRIALRMLTTMLAARGHVVHAVTDGAEALKIITDNPEIDALITSIE